MNDPEFTTGSGFGGQHDARVLSDGSVTIFDNGFHSDPVLRHPPRAVRYAIDRGAGTATLLEQINDPTRFRPPAAAAAHAGCPAVTGWCLGAATT